MQVILLLDSLSKSFIKTNIGELAMNGVKIINNLSDITKDDISDRKKIVLLDKYLDSKEFKGFDYLDMFKNVLGLEYVYLGEDEVALSCLNNFMDCYRYKIENMNYMTFCSALLGEYQEKTSIHMDVLDYNEIDAISVLDDYKSTKVQKDVANSFLKYSKIVRKLYSENDKYRNIIDKLQKDKNIKDIEMKQIIDSYDLMMDRAKKIDSYLTEEEVLFSNDVFKKVDISSYRPNAPTVIYFKVYSELIHMESFIKTLFDSVLKKCQKSIKILRIYDSNKILAYKTIPKRFHKLGNRYSSEELFKNDLLVKYGDYSKILDIFLKNEIKLDVLVIFDFKAIDDVIMLNTDKRYNICRNKNNVGLFGLDKSNTIVNNDKGNDLSWNTILLKDTVSDSDKALVYESKPVIQNIIQVIEEI